jgi:hypothetical protein
MVNVRKLKPSSEELTEDLKLAKREIQAVLAGMRPSSAATKAALKTITLFLKAKAAEIVKNRRKLNPKRSSARTKRPRRFHKV